MPTCLIVDDSSVVRKVARRILEDIDYTVEEAEDGQEAFGLEFLKLLRAYIGGEKPRIVYCTVENDIGAIALARKEGADDYMMKPFDRNILEAKFDLSRTEAV